MLYYNNDLLSIAYFLFLFSNLIFQSKNLNKQPTTNIKVEINYYIKI